MLLEVDFGEVSRTCCDMYILSKRLLVYSNSFEKLLCELCAEPSEVAVCRAVCRT